MRARGSAQAQSSFGGEHVPTLHEILDFAKEQDVIFYLEIKSGPAWGIEHAVVASLRDRNASAKSCDFVL